MLIGFFKTVVSIYLSSNDSSPPAVLEDASCLLQDFGCFPRFWTFTLSYNLADGVLLVDNGFLIAHVADVVRVRKFVNSGLSLHWSANVLVRMYLKGNIFT